MSTGRTRVADFLRTRREQLQPEQVGLPRDDNRRVPGLRREEVAELAGISAEYYVRLEQGRDHQPSDQVIVALSRALRLDDDEYSYLYRVSRLSPVSRSTQSRPPVAASVLQLLDQWSHTPAYVSDSNHDVLCANASARGLAPGYLEAGTNMLLSVFASGKNADRADDWEATARGLVASLRFNGDPGSPRLQEIVGTLSLNDREFRRMWASHDARPQSSGVTPALIDPLGWVEFNWQTLEIPGQHGQFLTTFFGTAGSPAAAAIAYLAARTASATRTLRAQLPETTSISLERAV